jgi:hypothetical protein
MMTEPLCRSSDLIALQPQIGFGMLNDHELRQLLSKWTADSDGFRAEAKRLEHSDLSRHTISVAMLEARAQALDRCILEVQAVGDNFLKPYLP